jgi:hypothetical protein
MSEQTKEMSSPDVAADRFVTAPDTAVFWSGSTKIGDERIGGEKRAAEIARAIGGTTLEMLREQRGISLPEYDRTDRTTIEAWEKASARFAAGASGTVRAVLGEKLRDSNIWESHELPALIQNARVTRIIAIDPATLKETMLFDRSAESTRNQAHPQQDVKGRDTDRQAAQAFMNEPRESALKQHPTLAGAYATMTAIEKQTQTSGLSNEQQLKVLTAARENVAKNIHDGQYPNIKIRETKEVTSEREHAYQR